MRPRSAAAPGSACLAIPRLARRRLFWSAVAGTQQPTRTPLPRPHRASRDRPRSLFPTCSTTGRRPTAVRRVSAHPTVRTPRPSRTPAQARRRRTRRIQRSRERRPSPPPFVRPVHRPANTRPGRPATTRRPPSRRPCHAVEPRVGRVSDDRVVGGQVWEGGRDNGGEHGRPIPARGRGPRRASDRPQPRAGPGPRAAPGRPLSTREGLQTTGPGRPSGTRRSAVQRPVRGR